MRRLTACLVALMLMGAALAAPALDPATGFVLSGEPANQLLLQCSRTVPVPDHTRPNAWHPTLAQIRDLEVRLPDALADALKSRQGTVRPGYGRQYGGFVIAGRKMIYVNAFPIDDFTRENKQHWQDRARRQPIIVCDGGSDFFGALYDPSTRKFVDFAFNGFA